MLDNDSYPVRCCGMTFHDEAALDSHRAGPAHEVAALRAKYETLLDNTRSRDETIAALRAERDIQQQRAERHFATLVRAEAEVAALRAERDAAIISEGCAIADREKAEAEVERMRPVVEAAEGIDGIVDFSTEGQWMRRVRNAVDTYRETK